MTESTNMIKVGSRKSELALIQTRSVIQKLKDLEPDMKFEIVTMSTTGDKILDIALSKIGEKSLFTKELENALIDKSVDFVVHSLKDLPTVLPEGMAVGAVCKRDDPRDAVCMHPDNKGLKLGDLPKGSIIGTSSLRRGAQLKRKYKDLEIKDVRGNLNTRFKKLENAKDYDCLILAVAGIERMGWKDKISQILEPDECMYAVSQGAMAVECRAEDTRILSLLSRIHDAHTVLQCVAEREFLKTLEGGCSVPVAVCTEITDTTIELRGGVYSIDGEEAVVDSDSIELPDIDAPPTKKSAKQNQQYACVVADDINQDAMRAAETLGSRLARKLIKEGADDILKVAKQQTKDDILAQKAKKELEKEKNGKTEVASN